MIEKTGTILQLASLPTRLATRRACPSLLVHFTASPRFEDLFSGGMALIEETAADHGQGRLEAEELDGSTGALYGAESMRLTTRSMQLASWLLLQRAVAEGEVTAEHALTQKKTIKLNRLMARPQDDSWNALPQDFQSWCWTAPMPCNGGSDAHAEIYGDTEANAEPASQNAVAAQQSLLHTPSTSGSAARVQLPAERFTKATQRAVAGKAVRPPRSATAVGTSSQYTARHGAGASAVVRRAQFGRFAYSRRGRDGPNLHCRAFSDRRIDKAGFNAEPPEIKRPPPVWWCLSKLANTLSACGVTIGAFGSPSRQLGATGALIGAIGCSRAAISMAGSSTSASEVDAITGRALGRCIGQNVGLAVEKIDPYRYR